MDPSVFRMLLASPCTGELTWRELRKIRLLASLTVEELQRDGFDAIYEVWTGFFKTVTTSQLGIEQVTAFSDGGRVDRARGHRCETAQARRHRVGGFLDLGAPL